MTQEVILFALVASFGILVQSFAGFGGALVTVPLFTLFMSPKQAVPTYAMVIFVTNCVLAFHARGHVQWRRVGKMLMGGYLGVPLGVIFLSSIPPRYMSIAINAVTIGFACLFILKVRVRFREDLLTHAGAGFISGMLGGSTAQSGPPVVILGLSHGWQKDAFRANLLAYFSFLTMWSLLWFTALGLLKVGNLKMGAVALLPMSVTAAVGTFIKSRTSEGFFRNAVLALILLVGLVGLLQKLVF